MHWLPIGLATITISLVLFVAIQLDGRETSAETGDQLARAWEQPHQIANRFPEPISRSRWQFDFEAAEEILSALRFTADDKIALDQATVILMKRLYDWQRALENPDVDLARVQFLVSRFFPNTTCYHSFSDLFARFTAYIESQNRLVSSLRTEELSILGSVPNEELFRLQEQVFSEKEIEGLFARQNRLTRYLTSRSRIIDNENLSGARRQHAEEDLRFDNDVDPDKAFRNGPCQ